MQIETKYNIGDTFYLPDTSEIHVNNINIDIDSQGVQHTMYRLGTGDMDNYNRLSASEIEKKCEKHQYFKSKKELLQYYIEKLA